MKYVFKAIIASALVMFVWGSYAHAESSCDKPVSTNEGPVIGVKGASDGVCAYKGIPFAAAPVGELRWKAPQPALKRASTLKATEYGARCMQTESDILGRDFKQPTPSEDCLFLNVWRPDKPGKFPVMVWIHGGAFIAGAGSLPIYVGEKLVGKDVIIVTINYRLGPLGFMAHPALKKEDPHSSTGNYGMLDEVAALKWVHDNISNFGGDPNNVTIFGESAGGYSVCYLLAMPLAEGLFQRAIMESGSCEAMQTLDAGMKMGEEFAADIGCGSGDAAKCMRSVPASKMIEAAFGGKRKIKMSSPDASFRYWPRVDGWSVPMKPIDALRSGKFNKAPFILGFNRDEIKLFARFMPKWVFHAPRMLIKAVMNKGFGKGTWTAIKKYFPLKNYSKPIYAAFDYAGAMMFGCPSYEAAMAVSKQGPAYYYRFDYDDNALPEKLGAAHGMEIPFVFDNFIGAFAQIYPPDYAQRARPLSDSMMSYWTNFAKTGNPNAPGLTEWPAFDPNKKIRMTLDLPMKAAPTDNEGVCGYIREHPRNP